MAKFFDFYKNGNFIIKIIFLGLALIMASLWVIGSFTKLDRLVMFLVGTVLGGALINIFLYDYVVKAIDFVTNIINSI